jgi:tRNA (uracil-5-)-methyltransferase TRM9
MVNINRSIISLTAAAYSSLADEFIRATSSYQCYPGLDTELRGFVEKLPDGIVLDIGCGSGRDSRLMKRLGRQTIASDISATMLDKLGQTDLRGSLVCCDVTRTGFADNSFAGVIASGVLLHLPKELCTSALREIERVLLPAGRAAISMKHGQGQGWRSTDGFPLKRWFNYYTPQEFAGLCEIVGLSVSRVDIIDREDWFVVHAFKKGLVTITSIERRYGGYK